MSTITDGQLEIVPGYPEGLLASYPNTGYWCAICGMPLHRYLEAMGSHPNCLEPPPKGAWKTAALAIEKKGAHSCPQTGGHLSHSSASGSSDTLETTDSQEENC